MTTTNERRAPTWSATRTGRRRCRRWMSASRSSSWRGSAPRRSPGGSSPTARRIPWSGRPCSTDRRTAPGRDFMVPRVFAVTAAGRRIEMDQHTFGLEPFEWRRWIKRHLEDVDDAHARAVADQLADVFAGAATGRPRRPSPIELWRVPALDERARPRPHDPGGAAVTALARRHPGGAATAAARVGRVVGVDPVLVHPDPGRPPRAVADLAVRLRVLRRPPAQGGVGGDGRHAAPVLAPGRRHVAARPGRRRSARTAGRSAPSRSCCSLPRWPPASGWRYRFAGPIAARALPVLAVPRAVLGRDEARPGDASCSGSCSSATSRRASGAPSTRCWRGCAGPGPTSSVEPRPDPDEPSTNGAWAVRRSRSASPSSTSCPATPSCARSASTGCGATPCARRSRTRRRPGETTALGFWVLEHAWILVLFQVVSLLWEVLLPARLLAADALPGAHRRAAVQHRAVDDREDRVLRRARLLRRLPAARAVGAGAAAAVGRSTGRPRRSSSTTARLPPLRRRRHRGARRRLGPRLRTGAGRARRGRRAGEARRCPPAWPAPPLDHLPRAPGHTAGTGGVGRVDDDGARARRDAVGPLVVGGTYGPRTAVVTSLSAAPVPAAGADQPGSVWRSAAFMFGSRGAIQVLSVAKGVAVARLLGPTDLGSFFLVSGVVGALEIASHPGLAGRADRLRRRAPAAVAGGVDLPRRAWRGDQPAPGARRRRSIAAWLHAPDIVPLLRVVALVPFIRGFTSLALDWRARRVDLRPTATTELVANVVELTAGIVLAALTHSAWGLVVAMLIGVVDADGVELPLRRVPAPVRLLDGRGAPAAALQQVARSGPTSSTTCRREPTTCSSGRYLGTPLARELPHRLPAGEPADHGDRVGPRERRVPGPRRAGPGVARTGRSRPTPATSR